MNNLRPLNAQSVLLEGERRISDNLIKALPLRVNFAWTFFANVVYAGCQWGMLSIISKLGSPDMVGKFALGLAIAGPIIIFADLSLRSVQVVDVRQEHRFGDYVGLRLISTVLAFLGIVGVALSGDYSAETLWIIILLGIAKGFEAISDVVYGLLQQRERMDWIAQSMVIKGLLSLAMFSISFYLTRNLVLATMSLALTWGGVLLFLDIPSAISILKARSRWIGLQLAYFGGGVDDVRPKFELGRLFPLLRLTLPLGIAAMLIALDDNIPRYFIERFLGERDLGFFAAIAYFVVFGRVVVDALGKSAGPRLARYFVEGDGPAFASLMVKLIAIGALLGGVLLLGAGFLGRWLLSVLYAPAYADHVSILVWVGVDSLVVFIYSFLGYGITAVRQFRIQPILFASANLISVISSVLLIPKFGILGAAWAMLCSSMFQLISLFLVNIFAYRKLVRG